MSLYEHLGVSEKATKDDIKKAFRKLSMQYHPDRGGGKESEEKYKEINHAYQVLSDEDKRKEYDNERNPLDMFKMMFGAHANANGNMAFKGHGEVDLSSFPFPFPDIQIFHPDMSMFSSPVRPIERNMVISLSEAYEGLQEKMKVERRVCKRKYVGSSENIETETIYIDVPEGIDHNEVIVIKEKGNVYDNIKGDIRVRIQIENDSSFERRGMNLIYKHQLTFKESLCGFQFYIEHINGKRFFINNQDGKVIYKGYQKVIKDLGMKRNGKTGNLIIEFDVDYPEAISLDTVEHLREIL